MRLAVSIVLYHDGRELEEAIRSVLNVRFDFQLYLIDNSKTNVLKKYAVDPRVTYIFNAKNLGYGAAHNLALKKSIEQHIKYHVIMNPDVSFEKGTMEKIMGFMENHQDIGALMPKIYYPQGHLQRLCKLLPTPFDLIGRRFLSNTQWAANQNAKYELDQFGYNKILNTPALSGCFMFLRTAALEKTGLFDERFFMYLEDYDLARRINRFYRTVFFPGVSIVHGFKKGSYQDPKLLRFHIQSAIRYFNKWGWFFDQERQRLNDSVLKQISAPY